MGNRLKKVCIVSSIDANAYKTQTFFSISFIYMLLVIITSNMYCKRLNNVQRIENIAEM